MTRHTLDHVITKSLESRAVRIDIHDLSDIEILACDEKGVPMSKQSPISGVRMGNIDRVMERFDLASVSTLVRPRVIMIGDGKL